MTYLIELPLFLLLMPAYPYGIICLVISFLLFCFIWRYLERKYCFPRKMTVRKKSFGISCIIACTLGFSFQLRWSMSSKVQMLANLLHLPAQTLVVLPNVLLALFSVVAVDRIINELWHLLNLKFPKLFKTITKRNGCMIAEVFLLDCFMLWFSCFRNIQEGMEFFQYIFSEAGTTLFFMLLNFFLVYVSALLFCVLAGGWRRGLSAGGILVLIWSIANHYVVLLHGRPLFLSVLRNFRTAMEVVGSYKISVDFVAVCLIFLFLIRFTLVRMIPVEQKSKEIVSRRISMLAGCTLFLAAAEFGLGFSSFSAVTWLWKHDVTVQGFPLCVLQDAITMTNPYKKPQGYDSAQFESVHTVSPLPDVLPDIILVLNESFSDLCDVYQIPVDRNPLADFYNVEGAVFGKACASDIGGGTNNSEFELLTSMSMYLMNSTAPFNYVDFREMETHCVNFLEQFGYQTMAMHVETPNNYSRDRAYPAMGFDEIALGHDAFSHNGMNGSRSGLDSEHYKELIERTEKQSEALRFSYLLTFQNHGGYEQNDDSLDTVHVLGDYGSLTDDLNEYLSSVQLSAEAFRFLTDYYSDSDRPVIICMVGDHQPSFAADLPLNGLSEEKQALQRRIVPFAIWANYEADFTDIPEWVSMTDLVPTLLRAAGLPLSVYYQKLLNLQEHVPVRNGSGMMLDSDGRVFEFRKDCEYFEQINEVFCLEYNALTGGKEYKKDLFFLKTKR